MKAGYAISLLTILPLFTKWFKAGGLNEQSCMHSCLQSPPLVHLMANIHVQQKQTLSEIVICIGGIPSTICQSVKRQSMTRLGTSRDILVCR